MPLCPLNFAGLGCMDVRLLVNPPASGDGLLLARGGTNRVQFKTNPNDQSGLTQVTSSERLQRVDQ